MRKVTLRPDKYYSVHELSEALGLAPYDLFNLINKSGIIYDLVDDQAVYKGAVIQTLIESTRCIIQDIFPSIGTS